MKPIAVGLEPILAYDGKEDKIFEDVKVDAEAVVEDMKTTSRRVLAFAVKIVYACKETIGYLLGKAAAEEKSLSGLAKEEKPAEEKKEEAAEEKKEEPEKPAEKEEDNAQQETKVEEEK
jgi:hypothetical protein